MRRKVSDVPNAKSRAFVYTCALVSLLVYGLPHIPKLQHGIAGTFSILWILFAGLAVAANLYFLLGADKERIRQLETQIKPATLQTEEPGRQRGRRRVSL
ncbi:MAG: hypothetical protein K6T83_15720 [Alicyclobacillus sp.]|nr:hypothetical protein [Alicyclobacillus sp.]